MAGLAPTRANPKGPMSNDILQAALAATPDLPNDDDVTEDGAQHTPIPDADYGFDEEGAQGAAPAPTTPAATGEQPPAPQASTPGATGEQPAPAAEPQAAAPAAAADPWAEYEEIEYDDGDTGEKFVVRAQKSYADKVKNGYARRSVMDRTTGFLGRHRAMLEPIIANKQFDDIAPVIDLGMRDREFAQFVANAHARRAAGLPLVDAAPAQAAPARAAAPAPAATTPSTEALRAQMLASIGDETDDYTRDNIMRATGPLLEVIAQQTGLLSDFQARQQAQVRQAQERQQVDQRQRQVGLGGRNLIMQAFPDEMNERTPHDQWLRVIDYGNQSGIFAQYGVSPTSILTAYQAMRSPMGLQGIGRAPATSVAAETIRDIRANGERLAAAAVANVAQQTQSGAPGGSAPEAPKKQQRVPRYVTDRRSGQKRLLTPKEIADYMARHPQAI